MQRTRFRNKYLLRVTSCDFFWALRLSTEPYHLEMVALIQRPAPTFKAEAVIEGHFLDVSLADYLGQWYV